MPPGTALFQSMLRRGQERFEVVLWMHGIVLLTPMMYSGGLTWRENGVPEVSVMETPEKSGVSLTGDCLPKPFMARADIFL